MGSPNTEPSTLDPKTLCPKFFRVDSVPSREARKEQEGKAQKQAEEHEAEPFGRVLRALGLRGLGGFGVEGEVVQGV